MMQFLLKQVQRSSHADVTLLQYRDFYFGRMLSRPKDSPPGEDYGDYRICANTAAETYCRLRVALDRVLWKGDFSERVMLDGKTLQAMLASAQQQTDYEQTLLPRDAVQEWLLTFGVVTKPPKNLSAATMGPETFVVPGLSFCSMASAGGTPQYCINGQKIADDGAYWVSTSDHLAQDTQVYKVLSSLDQRYHLPKRGLFLTGEIADEICGRATGSASACTPQQHSRETREVQKATPTDDAQAYMREIEAFQQQRPILQLDYAKVVAGFMVRRPDQTDNDLAMNFSGVSESRATTPHAEELDLEAVTRSTRRVGPEWLKTGIQSDLEYDRAFTGNLTNSPETVTYAQNIFTVGGFLQARIWGPKSLPRLLLVAAPFQYQQQITGNYLNFKFTAGSGQLTVPTPRAEGFNQRLGSRFEFGGGSWRTPDVGSYAEFGPEYSDINHILSGLLLPNGTVCQASNVSFSSCVAGNTTVTKSTLIKPLTETLHTGGLYWDVHLQKALDKAKHSTLTIETKGDDFLWPGAVLPTQTRYAFTTTGAGKFRGHWKPRLLANLYDLLLQEPGG